MVLSYCIGSPFYLRCMEKEEEEQEIRGREEEREKEGHSSKEDLWQQRPHI